MQRKLLQNFCFYLVWIAVTFALFVSIHHLGSYCQKMMSRTFSYQYRVYYSVAIVVTFALLAVLLLALARYGRAYVHTVSAAWLEFILMALYGLFFSILPWSDWLLSLMPNAPQALVVLMLRLSYLFTWLSQALGGLLLGWSLCFLIVRLHRLHHDKLARPSALQ